MKNLFILLILAIALTSCSTPDPIEPDVVVTQPVVTQPVLVPNPSGSQQVTKVINVNITSGTINSCTIYRNGVIISTGTTASFSYVKSANNTQGPWHIHVVTTQSQPISGNIQVNNSVYVNFNNSCNVEFDVAY